MTLLLLHRFCESLQYSSIMKNILIVLKHQEVYNVEKKNISQIFNIFDQVGEGQDVYFECLSQANPPVCKIF